MSPRFESWKTQIDSLPENVAAFERWLFVQIASVLFGGKAGELLILRSGHRNLTIEQQISCIERLSPVWNFSYRVLCSDLSGARTVIYDPLTVQEVLTTAPRRVFEETGYPPDVCTAGFLEEVGRRWRENGQIPHEIGLALGYPVKDVLGYMGLESSPCTGLCGWRIYGDRDPSLRKSREFRRARQQAEAFLGVSAG
jgi:hypothetical protein